MIKIIVAIAILVGSSSQQCTAGCLKCGVGNICLLCDVTNNYYQKNGGCVQVTIPSCAQLSQIGTCVLCNSGYYLDFDTFTCVAVPSANLITGCTSYNSQLSCIYCSGAYYNNLGNCVSANVTVSNCMSYAGNGVCSQCSTGYISSSDFSSCIQIPSINNCLGYSYWQCST